MSDFELKEGGIKMPEPKEQAKDALSCMREANTNNINKDIGGCKMAQRGFRQDMYALKTSPTQHSTPGHNISTQGQGASNTIGNKTFGR